MKIDGPKSSSEVQKKKDTKKTNASDGSFQSLMDDGGNASGTSSASMASTIAGVDALLAAQSAESSIDLAIDALLGHYG